MYIPRHFRQDNPEEIFGFLQAHPFGILLSARDGQMAGTHVPFFLEGNASGFSLVSHLAGANDQLDHFRRDSGCLVIFQGPHAYVSPSLYAETRNVPTWNFIAVHIYGQLTLLEDFGAKKDLLERTIRVFDPAYLPAYEALDPKYRDGLIAGMTGCEIVPERVEAKYKLSQNRSAESRERVTRHFEEGEHPLGAYMRALTPPENEGPASGR